MSPEQWEVIDEVGGEVQAELLSGLLKAHGIPARLAQEGVGHFAYAVTVGALGQVQILVPSSASDRARQVLADYYAGEFEATELDPNAAVEEEPADPDLGAESA